MFSKKTIFGHLIALGFLLGVTSGVTRAQMPPGEMPLSETEQTTQFRRIEQPLGVKVGVTVGGIALIGLELWWFIWSKTKFQQAETNQGIEEVTILVDGGYEPSRIVVNAGQKVRLNFMRRDPSSCLEQVLLPDFHIAQQLDLNHVTSVEFTPEKPGQYPFTCGMNMFRGVVEVQRSNLSNMNGSSSLKARHTTYSSS
ncbi:hypothetical protein CEN49_05620 [Fischerella thermalis CCMEE 5273]|uniref:EfeO-type cupredoxin-like domain-containing protein n=1 Tax=Chlorogloeopsis fritschii PCC 6912 TaxID=211165 RepID=A0A3S1ALC5_CHLFR|nr:cupredoxin domain-containing protein [Chlorogloeopsis fritschii]PMB09847.1 hypothetical protein CEN49_05620 [Fischerella thermalis CCMEE 5273]RUR83755.1 hypothetical protein PCC6912_19980 [Chlorogloeopsis fritschii PCC 6912]